jgi:hypothetical protein
MKVRTLRTPRTLRMVGGLWTTEEGLLELITTGSGSFAFHGDSMDWQGVALGL